MGNQFKTALLLAAMTVFIILIGRMLGGRQGMILAGPWQSAAIMPSSARRAMMKTDSIQGRRTYSSALTASGPRQAN